jgi:uncharacterized protein (TIGR02145 family)
MKKIIYLSTLFYLFISVLSFNAEAQNSVKIGRLVWMTQNLNVSTFRNGEKIPEANSKEEWLNAVKKKTPVWCYKDFDSKNGVKYGKLYNYYAVEDPRGLAPAGWAIPSEDDLKDLQKSTNNNAASGYNFKSKSGWIDYTVKETCPLCEAKTLYCSRCQGTGEIRVTYSGNGTNETGFSALPGGSINHSWGGTFLADDAKFWGLHWLSVDKDTMLPHLSISYESGFLIQSDKYKGDGFSVRCVKETKEYFDFYKEKQRIAEEDKRKKENSPESQKARQMAKLYTSYYTKDYKDLENKNIDLYIKIQETIINEWHRFDSLNIAQKGYYPCAEGTTLTCYSDYYTDVADFIIILIKNKKIKKASDIIDKFLNYNFPTKNESGLNMTSFKLLSEKPNGNYTNVKNFAEQLRRIKGYILQISIINDSKLTMDIMQEFLCRRDGRNMKDQNIYYVDYLEKELAYKIPQIEYYKFTIKAFTTKWDFNTSPNAKSKSWLQTYSSYFIKYLEDELYDKKKKITELVIKIDDNLYKSKIDSYNIYYYLDKNGTAFLVTKSAASISTDNEAKLIIKSKQIRDKDFLTTKK